MPYSLFDLLNDLDHAATSDDVAVSYTLARTPGDTIRVNVAFVGQRVEVDVFEDGHMEVSVFKGSEDVVGDAALIRSMIVSPWRTDD
jgi:hypothetical protein